MAQHDYDLANATGASFRADLNAALAAVQTQNSGSSAPSSTRQWMLWMDEAAGLVKQRNQSNNAWITIGTLGATNWGLMSSSGATQTNALGSATAPSYSFLNDSNTGAYSPGADIYAIAAGGVERFRINAAGFIKANGGGGTLATGLTAFSHEIASNSTTQEVLRLWSSGIGYSGPGVIVINANSASSNGSFNAINYYNIAAGVTRFSVNDAGTVLSLGSYNLTTASAANVFIDANGVFQRSTSSAAYKTDIRDLTDEEVNVVLELNPIRYRSLAESDNHGWSWYGLIAEDVAAKDPRLVHWGYKDEDYEIITTEEQRYNEQKEEVETVEQRQRQLKTGAELRPEGVQYERVGVLTLAMVQRLHARVEELEARLASLES